MELQHYRLNREKCNNGYEELKPVESNPTYDFDYQQTNFLPQEINVKPVRFRVNTCAVVVVNFNKDS